jgi:hypothetical protein
MTAIRKTPEMFMPTDTVLEMVQLQAGVIALRSADFDPSMIDDADELMEGTEAVLHAETETASEPLVTIKFSEQIQEALGEALQQIGQQMIQTALSALMEQQSNQWHAQVWDERPARLS